MKSKKNKDFLYDDVPQVDNIKDLVIHGVKLGQDKKFVIYHHGNEERTRTFNDVWHDMNAVGTFLYQEGLHNAHIAMLGENSYEWIAAFFSVIVGKNVFVPLDPKLTKEDLAEQLIKSDCDALFCSDEFSDKVEYFKDLPEMTVKKYYPLDSFPEYVEKGDAAIAAGNREFLDCKISPSDLACIVFTSGTTGKSKGVMLSHGNLAADVVASCQVMHGRNTVGFLPLNHTYSWVSTIFSAFICIEYGYICKNINNLTNDFKNYHPQNFCGVPLVVEVIYKRIWKTAKLSGREEILKKGIKISRFLLKLGIDKRRKIFSQIHEQLGGNLELIVCGGAALDLEYEQGLYDIGIQVLSGYGVTECSPAVTTNRIHNSKPGSVGLPLPCNEIKIHEPDSNGVGEIYVRGRNVMLGYYKDPEATADAFDGEWFKTGDFGRIDEDGFLFFTGRKKNLIVLKNGKNVSPEEIEDKLMQSYHYIKEVLVYEKNNRIVAELFLDEAEYPDARSRISADIGALNRTLPEFKRIGKHIIRDEEFPKTTTLKIVRQYSS